MNKKENFDKIERYMDDSMSSPERLAFEEQLEKDATLQAALRLHQDVETSLKGEKIHQFRKTLNAVDAAWQGEEKKTAKIRPINYKKYLSIAAAIALLIVAFLYFSPSVQTNSVLATNSPSELFESYHETYSMVLNQRSGTEEEDQISKAVQAYEEQDYKKAASIFQTLKDKETSAGIFHFYAALSELSAGNASAAIPLFEKINEDMPALYVEQSRWYLALAYLKNENIAAAKVTLQGIQKGAYQYEAATAILDKL